MDEPPALGGFADVDATDAPEHYARYVAGVRDLAAVRAWKARSIDLLEPRPGMVLLDAGCGTGEDVRALADRVGPGGRALGIDASAAMVTEARRRGHGPRCAFRRADVTRLPLSDASVDGARAERVLQHLADPAAAVRELARVVRPGGRVVVAEPDWGTLVIDGGDARVAALVAAAAGRALRSPAAGRSLRRLLAEAGLREVGVTARSLVLTGAAADRLLGLEAAAARAVAAGDVDAAAAATWRDAFATASAQGTALAAMTAFMAWGRRP
jgi:SAM-dependent methyltransferase